MYRDEFVTCGGVPLKEVREVSITLNTLETEYMRCDTATACRLIKRILIMDSAVFFSCYVIVYCVTSCCIGPFA
jgi:hypothetical protein